ncbi:MAG: copper amine oxidase N-terminal domain-containing protein [Firmicutes bacterium]|nr:copper amine oxidase N-terminal domain-containing protein [Bacillota bacterium]
MKKEKLKGFIMGIIVSVFLCSTLLSAFAITGTTSLSATYKNILIKVNGKTITPTDANGNYVEPFVYNGTTYLPVRAVASALGQNVDWDAYTNTVNISSSTTLTPVQPTTPVTPTAPTEQKTYTFSNGNYVAGKDFPAGTYNITWVSGSGNVHSDDWKNYVNLIMGSPSDDFYTQSFNNAKFNSGATLTVHGSMNTLTIKLTKVS